MPDKCVPYDSSSGDDGEDTTKVYKAALAKGRELDDTTRLVKIQGERIKSLEETLQPGVKK